MPLYCDLVALHSSILSCVTAPVVQIAWIWATSLQELQIKIRQQDVGTVYTGMFQVLLQAIKHLLDSILLLASVVHASPERGYDHDFVLCLIFGMCFNLFSGSLLKHIKETRKRSTVGETGS